MKSVLAFLAVLLLAAGPARGAGEEAQADPIAKVLQLLEKLTEQLKRDGEAEKKSFQEYTGWCGTVARNTGLEVERAGAQKAKLEAKINELQSDIDLCTSKIEDLAKTISTSNAELANATRIRLKESNDFVAGEEELLSVIEALNRAGDMLDRELKKNPAALMQLNNQGIATMLASLSAVVNAASITVSNQQQLQVLAEDQTQLVLDPEDPKTTDVITILKDLRQKAEAQLSALRKAEVTNKQNFAKLKMALESQLSADNKDMAQVKSSRAQAEEVKARSVHELQVAVKELKSASSTMDTTRATCMRVAKDHEASVAARKEELKIIAQATQTLQATTGQAAREAYGFLQMSAVPAVAHRAVVAARPVLVPRAMAPYALVQEAVKQAAERHRVRLDPVASQVVSMVEQLAKRSRSPALSQLASRLTAAARYGAAGGEDPLGKVKQMVRDMIAKLEKEQQGDGSEKAYCDQEMKKTDTKHRELTDKVSQLTAKLDQLAAHSAGLKEQVAALQSELANLAHEQVELNSIRKQSNANYLKSKADLEQGLNGVRQALSVLREYYANAADKAALVQESSSDEDMDDAEFSALMQQPAAPARHAKSSGPGSGIISLLEMIESDFATNLAKLELEETDAQASYEKVTQQNTVTKATKEKDATYRLQSSKSIDKSISEIAADRETASSELTAVVDYSSKLKERCLGRPETFEETKARRQAEISGLEEALEYLRRSAALVQRKLRGTGAAGKLEPAADGSSAPPAGA